MIMSKRSVEARLAKNVFVGELKELFFMTVKIIRMFPETPNANIKLEIENHVNLSIKDKHSSL